MTHSIDLLVQIVVLVPIVYIGVLYFLEEDGPFDIFLQIRVVAGFQLEQWNDMNGDTTEQWVPGDSFWSKVIGCHRCLTPYIAFLVVLLATLLGFLDLSPLLLLIWLGVTGSTVYLFEHIGG